MRLTLLLPGLLLPRQVLRDTAYDLHLPALAMILGRGQRQWLPAASAHDWVATACGWNQGLPAAPLRLLAAGGQPGEHTWLCLDPVHLRLEENRLLVDDPARLDLSADEDAALRQAVAPLLAAQGELTAGASPGCWHLRLAGPAPLHPALPEAVGRATDPAQPGGEQGAHWRRLLAEIQTVLHAHPVNRRREESGRPTVNSLWPWGGGRLGATANRPFDALLAGDPVLRGLAAHLGMALAAAEFDPVPGRVLAHADSLARPAQELDALAWRDALEQIERQWLTPALAAVRDGRCRSLRLVATGDERCLDVTLGRHHLWRLWRRPSALTQLAT